MRRFSHLAALTLMLLGMITISGFGVHSALAQETSTAGHGLVGVWLADTDTDDPTNGPALFTFTSDGTYSQVESDGSVGVGVWKADSATTATLTAWILGEGEDGEFGGMVTVRVAITLSEDGNSFTADYTLEFTDPAGNSSGQAGPGHASGTKLSPEAQGAPVMTLEEMFGGSGGEDPANSTDEGSGSEGEEENPEATPVS